MTTRFKTLFVISIAHGYYQTECDDISFVVPDTTAASLANGKILTRELGGKLYLLYEADETGAPLRPLPGQVVRLGLHLTNPFFSNFTDLSFATDTVLYRNIVAATALDNPMPVHLVGTIFNHQFFSVVSPVTISLKNSVGRAVPVEQIDPNTKLQSVSFDLTLQPPGIYTVEETHGTTTTVTTYYCDPELRQTGVFGVVEVTIDKSFYPASSPPEFVVRFDAQKQLLRYYVVARNNYAQTDIDQLSVSDDGFADDGRPQINFDKVPSSAFGPDDVSPAQLGAPPSQVLLFKSQVGVLRSQKARKKIQLKKNGDPLVSNLPQPLPDNPTSNLIVSVSKP
jgi:hypothetical protein